MGRALEVALLDKQAITIWFSNKLWCSEIMKKVIFLLLLITVNLVFSAAYADVVAAERIALKALVMASRQMPNYSNDQLVELGESLISLLKGTYNGSKGNRKIQDVVNNKKSITINFTANAFGKGQLRALFAKIIDREGGSVVLVQQFSESEAFIY